MVKFDKPKNLNGEELLEELASIGIILDKATQRPFVDGNDDLWLDIQSNQEPTAKTVVANHNGTITPPQPTVAEKLASVGLNLDDLKAALGL